MPADKPVTHGPVGSQTIYRVCECQGCGYTAKCTPMDDFYVWAKDPDDGPLYCWPCMRKIANTGVRPARQYLN